MRILLLSFVLALPLASIASADEEDVTTERSFSPHALAFSRSNCRHGPRVLLMR